MPTSRRLQVAAFLGVFSLFLYVANLVVYEAVADIFSITRSSELVILGVSLFIFSASFILASVLGVRYYNVFTRTSYLLSAAWLGIFCYLFLISVLYGLLAMLPLTLPRSVGEIVMAIALVVSVYGLCHAKDIKMKQVQVHLPKLPAEWVGKKAVWVSDLHLGQIHGASFTRKIVEKINAISHDIIFIGGDLYDGTTAPDLRELVAPLQKLSPALGVYFVTGNHEEFGNSGKFLSAVESVGVKILQDKIVEINGLQLVGADYHTASNRKQFEETLSRLHIDNNKASILLKHEPKDLDVAQQAGITFQISGHTHRAQLWPLRYIVDLLYKGFGYGLKSLDDMNVYVSSGVGTWGPPLRVGTDSEIVVFTFCASI